MWIRKMLTKLKFIPESYSLPAFSLSGESFSITILSLTEKGIWLILFDRS